MQKDYGTLKKLIYPLIITLLLIVIFLQRSCSEPATQETIKTEVTIPEKKGEIKKFVEQINYKKKDSFTPKMKLTKTLPKNIKNL
jgi:hypothetical protein